MQNSHGLVAIAKVATLFSKGQIKYFSILLCFLKVKKIINVNVAALAQITFPDALSFSIFAERLHSLLVCHSLSLSLSVSHTHTRAHTHIETTKPQRRESLVPSLSAEKKLSGWSARCISLSYVSKITCTGFPFSDR